MSKWFYAKDNQQRGPVTTQELGSLLAKGEITPSSLVWRQGMQQWTQISHVDELTSIQQPHYPLTHSSCSQESKSNNNPSLPTHTTPTTTRPNNIFALIGFILGTVSLLLCCCGFTAIPGLVLSIIGRVQISQNPAKFANKSMTSTGIVLNLFALVVYILAVIYVTTSEKELDEIISQLESSGETP